MAEGTEGGVFVVQQLGVLVLKLLKVLALVG